MKDTLVSLLDIIQKQPVRIHKDTYSIRISRLNMADIPKIRPLLYALLNNFERSYSILLEDIPYCLMPDAEEHIAYIKNGCIGYIKDAQCQICKYTQGCPGWLKDASIPRPPAAKDLPREIVIEVNKKCNLDCLICFKSDTQSELPIKKIKNVVDQCLRVGINTVRFSGGEPLLYKDIESALIYAKEKGLYTILNTNAVFLDKKIKGILKNYVDNALVSLQGYNSYSEEELTRSSHSFKDKLRNIAELNSLLPTLRIGTIISRSLFNNLPKYYYLLERLNIKSWEIFRPMTDKNTEEFKIGRAQILKIMRYIKKIKRNIGDVKIANPLPFCISKDYTLSQYTLLGAMADDGHSRLVFDPRGFFKPSYSICYDLGGRIKEAWHNPFLKKVRGLSFLPERCRDCLYLKWCRGGSRYLAKLKYGSYFSPDPLMRNA